MVKHAIKAVIGGSVWSHAASVGQRVGAGSTLLICEVMKCELPIETPVDGTVTWLRACGETVEVDDIVAIVESA